MTVSVSAAELRENFGLWHDRARTEPVRITDHGRETAYLVSAETFKELWSSFRKAVAVGELSDDEMAMILRADVPDAHAYETTDLRGVSDTGAPVHRSRQGDP